MKISVLIPTRNRFDELSKTISSIMDNAKHKDQIEIILRVDDDDTPFTSRIHELPYASNIKIKSGPRYDGYRSLDIFLNELYSIASGQWLFMPGDDCRVRTKDWDLLLEPFEGQPVCLNHLPALPHRDRWYFPILSSMIPQVLGYVARYSFYDGYIYKYSSLAGIIRNIDLDIHHEALKDQTRVEIDQRISEWRPSKDIETKKEWENVRQDAKKIKEFFKL